jgi:hypothetical protein
MNPPLESIAEIEGIVARGKALRDAETDPQARRALDALVKTYEKRLDQARQALRDMTQSAMVDIIKVSQN